MKAFVLSKLNSDLEWKDFEFTPLTTGQVKVKVLISGICGAQLQEIRGHKGNEKFLPHFLGHEGSGIVVETGPGVTKVKPGDKVVMHWRVADGIEADFPKYIVDGKQISSGKITTLSEFSVVSENRLTRIPTDVANDFAALLGCCITTALGVVNNEAKLRIGEKVAVLGCGGLGLSLIWGSRIAGASTIIGFDTNGLKEPWVMKLGASSFVNTSETSLGDVEDKFDVVVDTTGVPDVISVGTQMLSDRGRMVMVAQPPPGKSIEIPNASAFFGPNGKVIMSTQGGGTQPKDDIPRYIEMLKIASIDYRNLISETISPLDVNASLDRLRSGSSGRIVVTFHND